MSSELLVLEELLFELGLMYLTKRFLANDVVWFRFYGAVLHICDFCNSLEKWGNAEMEILILKNRASAFDACRCGQSLLLVEY